MQADRGILVGFLTMLYAFRDDLLFELKNGSKLFFAGAHFSMLSKLIDQSLLFAVRFEEETCFGLFQDKLYLSPWQPETEAVLRLDGLTLDAIWASFVKGIVGGEWSADLSLTENLTQIEERQRIEQEIARLEKLARKEKQPRKKFELVEKITQLKGLI